MYSLSEPFPLFSPGSTNKEFNFRHDWNTLISDDESLQMRYYSKKYFPHADDYVCSPQQHQEKICMYYIYIQERKIWKEMGCQKVHNVWKDKKSLPLEAPSPFNSISWSSKILQRVKFFDQPVLSNKTFSNLVDAKTVHLLKVLIN